MHLCGSTKDEVFRTHTYQLDYTLSQHQPFSVFYLYFSLSFPRHLTVFEYIAKTCLLLDTLHLILFLGFLCNVELSFKLRKTRDTHNELDSCQRSSECLAALPTCHAHSMYFTSMIGMYDKDRHI